MPWDPPRLSLTPPPYHRPHLPHPCSAAWVDEAHEQLAGSLGPQRAAAMGLLRMGRAACAGLLSDAQEGELDAGMRALGGHAFGAIQRQRLPDATPFQLHDYYYNVWKLRATPRSRDWWVCVCGGGEGVWGGEGIVAGCCSLFCWDCLPHTHISPPHPRTS